MTPLVSHKILSQRGRHFSSSIQFWTFGHLSAIPFHDLACPYSTITLLSHSVLIGLLDASPAVVILYLEVSQHGVQLAQLGWYLLLQLGPRRGQQALIDFSRNITMVYPWQKEMFHSITTFYHRRNDAIGFES